MSAPQYSGTPNEVIIEAEMGIAPYTFWQDLGDAYVVRDSMHLESPYLRRARRFSFRLVQHSGGLDIREQLKVRVRIGTYYVFTGYVTVDHSSVTGQEKVWDLTVTDSTILLSHGSRQIVEEITIPPGQSDLTVIAGGQLAVAAWQASHVYLLGDYVQPTTPNGHYYRATEVRKGGVSQPVEPVFSTVAGSVTIDNDLDWTEWGLIAWPGLMQTYCPEIAPLRVQQVIGSLPGLTFGAQTVEKALQDIQKWAVGAQRPEYSVTYDALGLPVLRWFDMADPAQLPLATGQFTDNAAQFDQTHIGMSHVERTRDGGAVRNAQTVLGPNGASATIDGSVQATPAYPQPPEFTVNVSTSRLVVTGHALTQGTAIIVSNTGGALPPPLTAGRAYYVFSPSPNTFALKANPADPDADYIVLTGAGTGTHTVQDARYDVYAARSYVVYNRLITGQVVAATDDRYASSDECRTLARALVRQDCFALDNLAVTSRGEIDPDILEDPKRVLITYTPEGLSAVEYPSASVALSFPGGVAQWRYELGDRLPEEGEPKGPGGLRGGVGVTGDVVPPSVPKGLRLLESFYNPARDGSSLRVAWNLNLEFDYRAAQVRVLSLDGDVLYTSPPLLAPQSDFTYPDLIHPSSTVTVQVRSEDTSSNYSQWSTPPTAMQVAPRVLPYTYNSDFSLPDPYADPIMPDGWDPLLGGDGAILYQQNPPLVRYIATGGAGGTSAMLRSSLQTVDGSRGAVLYTVSTTAYSSLSGGGTPLLVRLRQYDALGVEIAGSLLTAISRTVSGQSTEYRAHLTPHTDARFVRLEGGNNTAGSLGELRMSRLVLLTQDLPQPPTSLQQRANAFGAYSYEYRPAGATQGLVWTPPVSGPTPHHYMLQYWPVSLPTQVTTRNIFFGIVQADATGVIAGIAYEYRVYSVASNGETSSTAASLTWTTPLPDAPTGLAVSESGVTTKNTGYAVLAWTASPGPPFARYELRLRRAGTNEAYRYTSVPAGSLSVWIDMLELGREYDVYIRSVLPSGQVGLWSTLPVSLTVLPTALAAPAWQTQPFQAEGVTSGGLAWALMNWQTVAGASAYRLWAERVLGAGAWERITPPPIETIVQGGASVRGTLLGMAPGASYTYTIWAIDVYGQQGLPSTVLTHTVGGGGGRDGPQSVTFDERHPAEELAGWVVTAGDVGATYTLTTPAGGYEGHTALQAKSADADLMLQSPRYKVREKHDYQVGGAYSQAEGLALDVTTLDHKLYWESEAGGALGSVVLFSGNTGAAWQTYTQLVTAPAGAARAYETIKIGSRAANAALWTPDTGKRLSYLPAQDARFKTSGAEPRVMYDLAGTAAGEEYVSEASGALVYTGLAGRNVEVRSSNGLLLSATAGVSLDGDLSVSGALTAPGLASKTSVSIASPPYSADPTQTPTQITAAIQACLAANEDVYVPAGVWRIAPAGTLPNNRGYGITIPSGRRLWGPPDAVLLQTGVVRTDDTTFYAMCNVGDGSVGGVSNVTIEGLTMRGENSAVEGIPLGNTPQLLYLYGSLTHDVTLRSVTFEYSFGQGVAAHFENAYNIKILQCRAHHNGETGFNVNTTQTEIAGCISEYNVYGGFELAVTGSVIHDCEAHYNNTGGLVVGGLNAGAAYPLGRHNRISGIHASHNAQHGLRVGALGGETIVSDCVLHENAQAGLYLMKQIDPTARITAHHIKTHSNGTTGNIGIGIIVEAPLSKVTQCEARNLGIPGYAQSIGIQITGTDCVVENNYSLGHATIDYSIEATATGLRFNTQGQPESTYYLDDLAEPTLVRQVRAVDIVDVWVQGGTVAADWRDIFAFTISAYPALADVLGRTRRGDVVTMTPVAVTTGPSPGTDAGHANIGVGWDWQCVVPYYQTIYQYVRNFTAGSLTLPDVLWRIRVEHYATNRF